jgi:hypothetical protein
MDLRPQLLISNRFSLANLIAFLVFSKPALSQFNADSSLSYQYARFSSLHFLNTSFPVFKLMLINLVQWLTGLLLYISYPFLLFVLGTMNAMNLIYWLLGVNPMFGVRKAFALGQEGEPPICMRVGKCSNSARSRNVCFASAGWSIRLVARRKRRTLCI